MKKLRLLRILMRMVDFYTEHTTLDKFTSFKKHRKKISSYSFEHSYYVSHTTPFLFRLKTIARIEPIKLTAFLFGEANRREKDCEGDIIIRSVSIVPKKSSTLPLISLRFSRGFFSLTCRLRVYSD